MVPRWEWRSFAPGFGEAGRVLAAQATAVVESDELYVLSTTEGALVKVRDGLMDIKRLQQVDEEGLEQWLPVLKATFPLSPADLEVVGAALGVAPTDLASAAASAEALVADIRSRPDLLALGVHKTRHRSATDGCLVELTEVRAGGRSTLSVAIESEDPAQVMVVRDRLGLLALPNRNYARGLADLVGYGVRRSAVIDVGTNSVKFHVGEQATTGDWRTVVDRAEVTRLGEGLSAGEPVRSEPMRRTVDAIAGMVEEAERLGAGEIMIVGTAGLRMASNADDVIAAVRERSGVTLEVISGETEGRLAFRAATVGLPQAESLVVFDTGGGSSQFTFGHGAVVDEQFSVPVGAVRFTEQFGLHGAVSVEVLAQARAAIAADLTRIAGREPPELLVGMGGAVTNLAAVRHGLADYDAETVHGTVLDRAEIDRQIELYRTSDAEQRRRVVGLQPARAEVILAGACIVRTVLEMLGRDELRVSDRGLRHGVLATRFDPTSET